jgi:hypothetical protein
MPISSSQATFIARFIGVIISTETVDKTITVTVTDLDDEAPTNIQISNTDLPADSPVGTLVGTLSAFNTPSAVASGDGDMPISSSCEDTLGFEFVAIGDFKISANLPVNSYSLKSEEH